MNNLTSIVGLQLLIICCILLFLWLRTEGRKCAVPLPGTENIWCCPICTHIYTDVEDDLSTCPRCSSINKKGE